MWVDATLPDRTQLRPPARARRRANSRGAVLRRARAHASLRPSRSAKGHAPRGRIGAAAPRPAAGVGDPESVGALPEGAVPLDYCLRVHPTPIAFGLAHTDSNQHVNSLVYPHLSRTPPCGGSRRSASSSPPCCRATSKRRSANRASPADVRRRAPDVHVGRAAGRRRRVRVGRGRAVGRGAREGEARTACANDFFGWTRISSAAVARPSAPPPSRRGPARGASSARG